MPMGTLPVRYLGVPLQLLPVERKFGGSSLGQGSLSGSVWVAWFTREKLNGNVSNFWTVKPHRDNSWLANKMIKIREDIYLWIKLRIGNGTRCRFWSDNWSPFGNLRQFLKEPGNSRLGISEKATLASLFRSNSWRIPPARSDSQVSLHIHLTTVILNDREDVYEWEMDGKTICKCPTRDRLLSWGLQTDANCLLCNTGTESRDHLLFECPTSWSVWNIQATRCNLQAARGWTDSLNQMQSLSLGKLGNRLARLAWQASIYWLWHERNERLHRQIFCSVDSINAKIDRQIRNRIASLRDGNPNQASNLLQLWLSTEVAR
ncbi:unnamed protein product [Microthlaspi erraticum]|uniref:Reverse transcriptase zinc-binding domain-containing protein n=1 Tax=Microthlaspi erraticum TaxID=1685480 RepID=A0A6D2HML7_9BRAS|nr:unnamed protein product [Microthlaspi erraticum]